MFFFIEVCIFYEFLESKVFWRFLGFGCEIFLIICEFIVKSNILVDEYVYYIRL